MRAIHLNTETHRIDCPYCGEAFDVVVDPSAALAEGVDSYIEDCYVCCRPIQFTVMGDETGAVSVLARSENEC